MSKIGLIKIRICPYWKGGKTCSFFVYVLGKSEVKEEQTLIFHSGKSVGNT